MGHIHETQLSLQVQTSKLFALSLNGTAEALIKPPSLGKQKFILFPRREMRLVGAEARPPPGFVVFWEPAVGGKGRDKG